MIYIYTGPVQSGKTTMFMGIIQASKAFGGFLSPDVAGLRKLYFPYEDEMLDFEISKGEDQKSSLLEDQILSIGKFQFDFSVFKKAKLRTLAQAENEKITYILLDEVGKLELKDLGFHSLVEELLQKNWEGKKLILFIRDYLLDELIAKYNLQEATIISQDSLAKLI